MPRSLSGISTSSHNGDVHLSRERIRELLLAERAQINQAIREYPLPITACDDQFNHLLEKRSRITQELGKFNRLFGGHIDNIGDVVEQAALDKFIAESSFVLLTDRVGS